MPSIWWRNFDRGWWPEGPREEMPKGTLRRAVGIAAIRVGALTSRWGSVVLDALSSHSDKVHSLFRYRDTRFQGIGTRLVRNNATIQTDLTGNRLSFVAMAPTPGKEDYLFVAGGGLLVKVDKSGVVSQWGIDPPATDFIASLGTPGAGVLTGTYKYAVTFKNSVTGSRSNPNPATLTTGVDVTVTPFEQEVDLSSFPISSDPQVDKLEIWRTFANQSVLFKLDEIAIGTSVYLDNHPDADLLSTELPLDNARPDDSYDEALGPYQGRMFWARDSEPGNQGRIFYSPIGRPESVAGFLEINNGDDPVVALRFWGGSLYGFTNGKIIQVIGFSEPFTFREVYGCPGTTQPFSVVPTPVGIAYHSWDGIRLFNGTGSVLVGYDAIASLLTGVDQEGVPAFVPVIGAYDGREVWFSDEVTTLVIDVRNTGWRIAEDSFTALYFEPDTQLLTAGRGGFVIQPEPPHVTLDAGELIAFQIETPGYMADIAVKTMIHRIHFDVDTGGNFLTPSVVIDDVVYPLATFQTVGRPDEPVDIAVGKWGRVHSVRLEGDLATQVTVYGIECEIYQPSSVMVTA